MQRPGPSGAADDREPGADRSSIELAFLERLIVDAERDALASVDVYKALFPQIDDLIDELHARVSSDRATIAGSAPVQRVGARYRLIRPIGSGGQSTVYLAEDERLERRVAIKLLRGVTLGRRASFFEREARLISRLETPGVCRLFDAGIDGDSAWLAMEFVTGETLAQWIDHRRDGDGPPGANEVRTMLGQIAAAARALDRCHAAGIVHRDVKPSNLMIDERGDVVLLDFGVARFVTGDAATLTATGERFGTPRYMSPEQLDPRGVPIDHRTDIYSLGATLAETLTLLPFRSDALPIHRDNAAIDGDLEAVLARALEARPADRYATAAEFADDLDAAKAGRPVRARRVGAFGRLARFAKRAPALAASIALGVVALAALATFVTLRVVEAPQRRAEREARLAVELDDRLSRGWVHASAFEWNAARASFDDVAERAIDAEQRDEATIGQLTATRATLSSAESAAAIRRFADSLSPCLRMQLEAQHTRLCGDEAGALAIEANCPAPITNLEKCVTASGAIVRSRVLPAREAQATLDAAYDLVLGALLNTTRPPRLSNYAQLSIIAANLADHRRRTLAAQTVATLWPDRALAAFFAGLALAGTSLRFSGDDPNVVDVAERQLLEAAVQHYLRAVALDPTHAIAHLNLGNCQFRLGQIDAAEGSLRRATQLQPDAAEAHNSLGLVLERRGDAAGAIACYERALALRPDAMFRNNLAVILASNGRIDEAMEVTRAAVDGAATSSRRDLVGGAILYNIGVLFEMRGDPAKAAAAYRSALATEPDLPYAHVNLGTLLESDGDTDAALEHYRRATEIDPTHVSAWINLGQLLRRVGRPQDALPALQRGHELGSARPDWPHDSAAWVRDCEREVREQQRE